MDLRYLNNNECVWRWEKEELIVVWSWLGKCVVVTEWASVGLESSHGAGGKESSEGRGNRFLSLNT